MYRHFAIITLAVTFCLAMFADGEHRDAMLEKAQEREAQNRMMQAEKEKVGEKKFGAKGMKFRDARSVKGSFGSDSGPPADNEIRYSSGSNVSERRPAHGSLEPPSASERELGVAYDTPDVLPPGMSEEQMRKFILIRKGEKAKKRPTISELDQMVEASRQRSGAENDDED